jgi:hypothetical protein
LRLANAENTGNELEALQVGPAPEGRRCDLDGEGVAVAPGDRGTPGTRLDADPEHDRPRALSGRLDVEQVIGHGRLL